MASSLLVDLLPSWLLALKSERKSQATIDGYRWGVRAFLTWCDESGAEPELTKANVQAFVASMLDRGAEAATARTRYSALRRYAAWLTEEGEIDHNPFIGMAPPKLDTKVTEALSDDQLQAMIKACRGKDLIDRRDEAVIRMFADTGCRASELLGMSVGDVDVSRGVAVVRRGKGGKGRTVPFSPQTASAIDRYLRARRAHRLAESGALWLGGGGQGFGYTALDKTLKKRAAAAGVTGFHIHLMRHSFSTRWLRKGGSEAGLMSVAGWSSRAMLDRYVAHSASERAAAEAQSLDLGL